jgi:hypothetical protein
MLCLALVSLPFVLPPSDASVAVNYCMYAGCQLHVTTDVPGNCLVLTLSSIRLSKERFYSETLTGPIFVGRRSTSVIWVPSVINLTYTDKHLRHKSPL